MRPGVVNSQLLNIPRSHPNLTRPKPSSLTYWFWFVFFSTCSLLMMTLLILRFPWLLPRPSFYSNIDQFTEFRIPKNAAVTTMPTMSSIKGKGTRGSVIGSSSRGTRCGIISRISGATWGWFENSLTWLRDRNPTEQRSKRMSETAVKSGGSAIAWSTASTRTWSQVLFLSSLSVLVSKACDK